MIYNSQNGTSGDLWRYPCTHTTLFQRLYNIHNVETTSCERSMTLCTYWNIIKDPQKFCSLNYKEKNPLIESNRNFKKANFKWPYKKYNVLSQKRSILVKFNKLIKLTTWLCGFFTVILFKRGYILRQVEGFIRK